MSTANEVLVRRGLWTFDVTARKLLEAVRKKVSYHNARHEHWKAEFEKLKAELPTSIELPPDDLMQLASVSNSYARPGIAIDAKLQRKLAEAVGKLQEHSDRVREFSRWERALNMEIERNSDLRLFALTFDDVTFFGL